MKTTTVLLLLLGFFLSTQSIVAQKKFTKFSEQEGITFFYKWKRTKCLKKDSPLMLVLMVSNSKQKPVMATFTVDYYWQGIRDASSEPKSICVKANKKMKGKYRDLAFDRSKFSNEDLFSDKFILEISGIKVEEVTSCKK